MRSISLAVLVTFLLSAFALRKASAQEELRSAAELIDQFVVDCEKLRACSAVLGSVEIKGTSKENWRTRSWFLVSTRNPENELSIYKEACDVASHLPVVMGERRFSSARDELVSVNGNYYGTHYGRLDQDRLKPVPRIKRIVDGKEVEEFVRSYVRAPNPHSMCVLPASFLGREDSIEELHKIVDGFQILEESASNEGVTAFFYDRLIGIEVLFSKADKYMPTKVTGFFFQPPKVDKNTKPRLPVREDFAQKWFESSIKWQQFESAIFAPATIVNNAFKNQKAKSTVEINLQCIWRKVNPDILAKDAIAATPSEGPIATLRDSMKRDFDATFAKK